MFYFVCFLGETQRISLQKGCVITGQTEPMFRILSPNLHLPLSLSPLLMLDRGYGYFWVELQPDGFAAILETGTGRAGLWECLSLLLVLLQ